MNHIATYYGMGAYFPPADDAMPRQEPEPPQQLSRAIRVFCSYRSRTPAAAEAEDNLLLPLANRVQYINPDPIYCNVELSEEEFRDQNRQRLLIQQVAHDVGVKATEDFFALQINLQHAERSAVASRQEDGSFPQLTICGGDSLLQPHFITASGANFGLLGLIEFNRLMDNWLRQGPSNLSHEHVIVQYNEFASLLQKQSCQTIVNLFGRSLVERA